jgi:uncharacterized protein (TIGR01777 family)
MDTNKYPLQSTALNYLVTGGTGFIGGALCEMLLAKGHHVTILTRQFNELAGVARSGVTFIRSFTDLSPDAAFDVVINLAGEPVVGPRWTADRRSALHASRRDLTKALVGWIQCATHLPRLMISASAIGYYGIQDERDKSQLSEDAPAQPIFMSELCQEWENAAIALEPLGVPVAIIRLGVVLAKVSSGKGALPKMVQPLRFGLGGRIGSGEQIISWVHLDDVLGVIEFLQSLPPTCANGFYNLCAPQPSSQEKFMQEARRWIGPAAHLPLPVPGWILRLALGEQAGLLVQGQRVIPRRLLDLGYQFRWPALSLALEACLNQE